MTAMWRLVSASCVALAGCTALLPRARNEDVSPFASFEAAREAFERAVPYRTTLAELKALGFDAQASGNVRQIPYPQLVAYLVPNPTLELAQLDVGIRDCIAARQSCRAYEFRFGAQVHERRGGFIADFLNFRRVHAHRRLALRRRCAGARVGRAVSQPRRRAEDRLGGRTRQPARAAAGAGRSGGAQRGDALRAELRQINPQWLASTGTVIDCSTARDAPPSTNSRARLWP